MPDSKASSLSGDVETAFESPPTPPEHDETAFHLELPIADHRADHHDAHNNKQSMTKAPKEALKAVYNAGIYKANLRLDILILHTVMAGIYIAMAGQVFLSAGGGVLGACFFSVGLIAVVLTSGELFTGDALVFTASLLGGKVTWRQMVRNWTVSWLGNFVGCLIWAVFMVYLPDSLSSTALELAVKVAKKKAFQAWGHIFLKAVGANFLVCIAVWQATCAEEVAGKILALWFPITGFVMMGFEHSIANQFFIPAGMMLMSSHEEFANDEKITITRLLFQALLPATLGNLVGGGIFVGAVYWYAFDSMEAMNRVQGRIQNAWKPNPNRYDTQGRRMTWLGGYSTHFFDHQNHHKQEPHPRQQRND